MASVKKANSEVNTTNYPKRMGISWKDDEIRQLLNEVRRKLTIVEIAAIHERTPGGISAKLNMLAADYHFYDGRPNEEIMKFTGLTHAQVNNAIDQRKAKIFIAENRKRQNEEKKSKKLISEPIVEPTPSEIMEAIKDIQRRMAIIERLPVRVVCFRHDAI